MGYTDKHLMADEKVVFRTKLNWTLYFKSAILLLVGLNFLPGGPTSRGFGVILLVIGLVSGATVFLRVKTSEFVVTNRRVLIKVGILKTESLETMLNKVEGIHVEQGIIGKLVNSGSIIIKGTGGTNNPFRHINNPFDFRNAVNEQIAGLK